MSSNIFLGLPIGRFRIFLEKVFLQQTLVDFQLYAQNSYIYIYIYIYIYNTFIKILYMFRALPCSSSGGLRRNCIQGVPGGMCQTSGGFSLC